jgi:multidrug efflux system membrane fusion protein
VATITQIEPHRRRVLHSARPRARGAGAARQGASRLPAPSTARARAGWTDGTFSTLDNLVDTTTGTVKAKARFGNADNALFPNQFVNLQLLLRKVSARWWCR